jgi:hypothetical protein
VAHQLLFNGQEEPMMRSRASLFCLATSAWSILAILFGTQAASADEVRLKSGGHLIGIAREGATGITVELPYGTVVLPRDKVAFILPGRTALHEYEERSARAARQGDAADYFELALWARRSGITRDVTALLSRVLEIDPRHEEAHRLLGHVFTAGRWLSEHEYATVRRDRESRTSAKRPVVGRATAENQHERRTKGTVPESVPYSLGLPRYAPSRGSHVWGGGWYSTFGGAWYLTPYARGIRGFVPPVPPVPESSRRRHPGQADAPRSGEPRRERRTS